MKPSPPMEWLATLRNRVVGVGVAVVLLALLVAMISTARPVGAVSVTGAGLVIQHLGEPAQFCVGGVNDSLPPQCPDAVPVEGLAWNHVGWAKVAGEVRFAEVRVTGWWSGGVLTVRSVAPVTVREPVVRPWRQPSGSAPPTAELEEARQRIVDHAGELRLIWADVGTSLDRPTPHLSVDVFILSPGVQDTILELAGPVAPWVVIGGQLRGD